MPRSIRSQGPEFRRRDAPSMDPPPPPADWRADSEGRSASGAEGAKDQRLEGYQIKRGGIATPRAVVGAKSELPPKRRGVPWAESSEVDWAASFDWMDGNLTCCLIRVCAFLSTATPGSQAAYDRSMPGPDTACGAPSRFRGGADLLAKIGATQLSLCRD